jgi:hypothetical protein
MSLGPLPPANVELADGGRRPSQAYALYLKALDALARTALQDPGAWTAYTPSLTPGTGAFASASATGKFLQLGKTVHFQAVIAITTNGTAATNIAVTLPTTANGDAAAVSRQTSAGNNTGSGRISGGTTTCTLRNYDGTYPGADGMGIVVSGVYETT